MALDQEIIDADGRGWVRRTDGGSGRVTYRLGSWGYWSNGWRREPFATREEAVAAFLADVEVGSHDA